MFGTRATWVSHQFFVGSRSSRQMCFVLLCVCVCISLCVSLCVCVCTNAGKHIVGGICVDGAHTKNLLDVLERNMSNKRWFRGCEDGGVG